MFSKFIRSLLVLVAMSATSQVFALYPGMIFVKTEVDATDPDAPTVKLSWDQQHGWLTAPQGVQVGRREFGSTGAFKHLVTVPRTSATFPAGSVFVDEDPELEMGKTYEYRVIRPNAVNAENSAQSYGSPIHCYIAVTIGADLENEESGYWTGKSVLRQVGTDLVDSRGTLIFVVDDTLPAELEQELQLAEMDLVGDGWDVKRITHEQHQGERKSPATGNFSHIDLKNKIKSVFDEDPDHTKALYLFGRLPVVRSGAAAPDGHQEAKNRAHETDVYYADMYGTWTDTQTLSAIVGNEERHNIPGDGKFDQTTAPELVALMTGRVDFTRLTRVRKSEREHLRDYITKAHAWKHGLRLEDVPYRAASGPDGRGEFNNVQSYFASMSDPSFLPNGNVDFNENFFSLRNDDMVVTQAFTFTGYNKPPALAVERQDYRTMYSFIFGSWHQHWYRWNSGMRHILAQADYGLASGWGERPTWWLHHMAAGTPVGYSWLRIVNGRGGDYISNGGGAVWLNLMGDPTVRALAVKPPKNLRVAAGSGSNATLVWEAPDEWVRPHPSPAQPANPFPGEDRVGYHVYRSTERTSGYVRLTAEPIEEETFSDTTRPTDKDVYYQVRSVALTTVPTGSYYNQSQGIFNILRANGRSNVAPVARTFSVTATTSVPTHLAFDGTGTAGVKLTPIVVKNPEKGQVRWQSGNAHYTSNHNFTGTDKLIYRLWDGLTLSRPVEVTINVVAASDPASRLLLGWQFPNVTVATANPASTYRAQYIKPAELTVGPIVTRAINDGSNTFNWDAFALRTSMSSANLNPAGYITWKVESDKDVQKSLERITFFTFVGSRGGGWSWDDHPVSRYNIELRASTDGFTTYHVLPLDGGSLVTSGGMEQNGGVIHSADLRGIAALQGTVHPVEFRLYIWNMRTGFMTGIGKTANTYPYYIAGTTTLQPDYVPLQTSYSLAVLGTTNVGAPIVDAGPNRTYLKGTTVALDGSRTIAPFATYEWMQVRENTTDPLVTLADSTTLAPTFTAAAAGVYTFELRVTNDKGVGTARVRITISEEGAPPVVAVAPVTPVNVSQRVNLIATVQEPTEGLIYKWEQIGGPAEVSINGDGTLAAHFTPPAPGTYSFRFTAEDSTGKYISTGTVTVTVFDTHGLIFYEPFDYDGSGNLADFSNWHDMDEDSIDAQLVDTLEFNDGAGYRLSTGKAAAMKRQEYSSITIPQTKSFRDERSFYMSAFFKADIGTETYGGSPVVALQLSTENPELLNDGLVLGITNAGTTAGDTAGTNTLRAFAGMPSRITFPTRATGLNIQNTVGTAALENGKTYFLVGKFAMRTDNDFQGQVSLLVVPSGSTIPAAEPTTWTSQTSNTITLTQDFRGDDPLNFLVIGQGFSPAVADGASNVIDEIRIGTTYQSVVPTMRYSIFDQPEYEAWAASFDWRGYDSGARAIVSIYGYTNWQLFEMNLGPFGFNLERIMTEADFEIEQSGRDVLLVHTYDRNTAVARSGIVRFAVMQSTDLENWTPVVHNRDGATQTTAPVDAATERITTKVKLSPNETAKFLRLEISNR